MTETITNAMLLEAINDLRARISHLEAAQPRHQVTQPAATYIDACGLERDTAKGERVLPDGAQTWGDRMKTRQELEQAEEDARWAARAEGLPIGFWRDPMGIVRRPDGTSAAPDEYRQGAA